MSPRTRRNALHLSDLIHPVHHLRVMGRLVRRSVKKPGSPPGTLVHTGTKRVEQVRIQVLRYDPEGLEEWSTEEIDDCLALAGSPGVLWVNVQGLHDVALLERLGQAFDIHPLVVEDLLSIGQRTKVEDYDDYLFIVLHMLTLADGTFRVDDEQVGIILGRRHVFTFQEKEGDPFDPVRDRLRAGKGQIRARGADYLAYALVDAVVDGYFTVLERVGDRTEELETEVMEAPRQPTMHRIHELKRELLVLRRAAWPLRETVNALIRSEGGLIAASTKVFLRDVYDHAVQVIDTTETLRDVVTGLNDLYLSSISNRINEIMKVLTIMASIFIPLTFVAGVYGMNFEHMPELAIPWAYPAVLGFMLAAAGGLLWLFRRKGWL